MISIVIVNFNYARYLSECIDSGLAQCYPSIEVIVVDDGSTDNSLAVAKSYGDLVTVVAKRNGGQGSAINAGFLASHGDWVAFVDADDLLAPDALSQVASIIAPNIVKVQFGMEVIDERSNPTGVRLPTRRMDSANARRAVERYGYYISPPCSGNMYSREFLKAVLPMPEEEWGISADAYLILAAPFFGSIASIERDLAKYRRHGAGASDLMGGRASRLHEFIRREMLKEERRAQRVLQILQQTSISGSRATLGLSPTLAKYRLLDAVLSRVSYHSRGGLMLRVIQSAVCWPDYRLLHRVLFIAWAICIACLPRRQVVALASRSLLPHWRRRAIVKIHN